MADEYDDEQDQGDESGDNSTVKALRTQARKAEKLAQQQEERAVAAERRSALAEAGLTGLSDRQRKALLATHEGELTAAALKETAVDLGFAQSDDVEKEDKAAEQAAVAQDRVSAAASGGGPVAQGAITPEMVAGWSLDKRMRFLDEHPKEYDLLLQGESVTGIPYT